MKIFFIGIILFFGIFYTPLARAQDFNQLPQFLPPPPDAFKITKSAETSVSMNNGAANVSVPLFEYKIGGKTIPLALRYSSNGVLVDEIPSKVGINWSFNPGGVITRTVMHGPDETIPLRTPPSDPFNLTQVSDYVQPIAYAANTEGFNTQPDEYDFSFGNISGKFFYDHTGAIKLTSYSKVKIEKKTSPPTWWQFKITDEEGIIYYFGGTNAVERAKYNNQGCPRNQYSSYLDVAYHLSRVEYPNGDVADYNYSTYSFNVATGVTQTIMARSYAATVPNGFAIWGSRLPSSSVTTCQNITTNLAVALQSIVCNNGTTVSFSYNTRTDIPSEKAYNIISLSYNGSLVRKMQLLYTYSGSTGYTGGYYQSPPISFSSTRLFLTGVLDYGKSQGLKLSTTIEYDDMNGLPPRLSTAQDHYGYFNGQNNLYYFPAPNIESNEMSVNPQSVGQQAVTNLNNTFNRTFTGNKEPDLNFAKKGTLKKIKYATGGTTSFEYELNTINKEVTVYPASQTFYEQAVGTCPPPSGSCEEIKNFWVTINYSQLLYFNFSTGSVGQEDPLHSQAHLTIFNSSNQVLYNQSLSYSQYPGANSIMLAAGTYRIQLVSANNSIPANLTYSYRPGNTSLQNMNINVPGLRVKSVVNEGKNGDLTKKKYIYASFSDTSKSTGQELNVGYYQNFINTVNYGYYYWDEENLPVVVGQVTDYFDKLQSSTNFRAYTGGPATINYASVIEADGDNFENGATEHQYFTSYNSPGQQIYGNRIPFATLANNSFMNGIEQETHFYVKKPTGLTLQKKQVNDYSVDSRNFSWYNGFVLQLANQGTSNNWAVNDPAANIVNFDIMMYPRYSYWVHLNKTTEYLYDEFNNELITEKEYTYDNINVLKPGSESIKSSDQSVVKTVFKYVPDHTSITALSSTSQASAVDMLAKNIYTPLFETQEYRNNVLLNTIRTDYKLWPNAINNPQLISHKRALGAFESRIQYEKYSAKGNAIELKKVNDIPLSYLWGYSELYPVMEAANCSTDEIYYNSFEDDVTASLDDFAKTGNKVKLGSFTVSFIRPNAKQYLISYHIWNGTSWIYHVEPYTGSSYAITGTKIDEIRVYPKNAGDIKTYSYNPYIGVSAICESNGKASYYLYDDFNRLALIKDDNGHIIKRLCYNYFGTLEHCNITCVNAANTDPVWVNTGNVRCQLNLSNCSYTGYEELEQSNSNICSIDAGWPTTQWVLGSYNPGGCASSGMVQLNVVNNVGAANLTLTITQVAPVSGPPQSYSIPAASGPITCILGGRSNKYNIAVTATGLEWLASFTLSGVTVSNTPAFFDNVGFNAALGTANLVIESDF